MKKIIRIQSKDHISNVGIGGITDIFVHEVSEDGSITYQVIKNGKPEYFTSKTWFETSKVGVENEEV